MPNVTQLFSMIAVAGAWIGSLALLFSLMGFCFGILQPRLFRYGLIFLVISAAALAIMLLSLCIILENVVLIVFSAIGAVTLAGFVAAAFIIIRNYGNVRTNAATVIETTRKRIEF
jgi:hypothetical protein